MPPRLPASVRPAVHRRLLPVARALVADLCMVDRPDPALVEEAAQALLRRVGGMAPHLGAGLAALTLAFDLSCGPGGYASLSPEARRRALERARALPGPLASWSQFFDKFAVFTYWSCWEARHGHG